MASIKVRVSQRMHRPRRYNESIRRRNVCNLISVNVSKPGPPLAKVIPKCLVLNARSLAKPDAASALCTEVITNKTRNINNLIPIPLVTNKNPPKSYDIPTILSTNVRSLPKKIDELQQIAELNYASVICITESWLSPNIPDHCVSIPGFNLFRKDRIGSSGGGVCVYLDNKKPCNHLDSCDQSDVESIWVALRPHKLPREITSIILGVIYHSTSNKEPENVVLRDHVQNNLNTLLCKEPNALQPYVYRFQNEIYHTGEQS